MIKRKMKTIKIGEFEFALDSEDELIAITYKEVAMRGKAYNYLVRRLNDKELISELPLYSQRVNHGYAEQDYNIVKDIDDILADVEGGDFEID